MVEKIYLIAPEKIGTINPDIYGVFAEHIGGVIYDGIYCGDKAENVRGFRKEIIEKLKAIRTPLVAPARRMLCRDIRLAGRRRTEGKTPDENKLVDRE